MVVAVDVAEAAELEELATAAILEALTVDEAGTGDPVATAMEVEERAVDVAAGADEYPEIADTAAVAAVKAELRVDFFTQGILRSGCATANECKDRQ